MYIYIYIYMYTPILGSLLFFSSGSSRPYDVQLVSHNHFVSLSGSPTGCQPCHSQPSLEVPSNASWLQRVHAVPACNLYSSLMCWTVSRANLYNLGSGAQRLLFCHDQCLCAICVFSSHWSIYIYKNTFNLTTKSSLKNNIIIQGTQCCCKY